MSNNGNSNGEIKVKCTRCGAVFNAPLPSGEIFNSLRVSTFVSSHEKLISCKSCPQKFVVGIGGVQVNWEAEPVPDEIASAMDPSRIILPGPTTPQ